MCSTPSPSSSKSTELLRRGHCVVGLLGSGKTTASSYLAQFGFTPISAGAVVAELAGCRNPRESRRGLQEYGMMLIREHHETRFTEELLSRARGNAKVVFDGVRIATCVRQLKAAISRCDIVFIDCPVEVCRERVCERDGLTAAQYDAIIQVPIETDCLSLRQEADWIVPNDGDHDAFLEALACVVPKE